MDRPIYLDYNAGTPVAPEVLDAMLPYLRERFGNPSSTHPYGVAAREAVEKARHQVAEMLGAEPDEIIFLSGGTESDNLAILGLADLAPPEKRHAVTSIVEHPAVEEALRSMEGEGWRVTRLPVGKDGRVDAAEAVAALRDDTAFVTLMHANNETGALQPVAEIAAASRVRGIPVHTDAAQSGGKIPLNVADLGVDLLSLAGHKLYAPQGIGALYVRRGVRLRPQLLGAGHEGGMRAGTENVASVVGLGAACALATKELPGRTDHLRALRDRLHAALLDRIPDLRLNGPETERLPNTLNVSIPGVDANALLSELEGVATSAGAACHAGGVEPSAVLLAMGLSPAEALGALRLTVGRPTTEDEIDRAAGMLVSAALRLRGEEIPAATPSVDEVRLTRYTRGLGCACKLRPRALEEVLRGLATSADPRALVGAETSDDAAVYRMEDGHALVATADFFTPVVDDPAEFGAVAAANALSDLYAMGATPLFALNLVGFPSDRLPLSVLRAILDGASAKAAEAGISILGGHTVDAPEPQYGLAAIGHVDADAVWTNAGGKPGDRLVLTKRIGTGVLTTAAKRNMIEGEPIREAVRQMAALNRDAMEAGREARVHACTDVTGFGLLGHLHEMARASGVAARVEAATVPLLEGAREMAGGGAVPGGTEANRDYLEGSVLWSREVAPADRTLLCDAQTSGGLLFAVAPADAEALRKALERRGVTVAVIGELVEGPAGSIDVS